MAGGVNVKMGVSGVAQFKKNIGDAKQAVKTLDAQLQLTEKEFKANGDAEEYMVKKSAELEAKLEAQKRVVDNAEKALKDMAEKGIDKGSKAYQDMYRTMLQAKGEMLDTEAALDGIAAAGDEAADSTADLADKMDGVSKGISWQNVTDGIDKITGAMEEAAKKAYKLGSAIVKEVLGVGTWADDINTRAKVLGVSPEDLQRMEKTARLIDTDAETIIKARQKLNKNIGSGNKGAMEALEALGISTEGNPEDVFWAAGKALMDLGDETEQEAKANAIFGKSWHELIPLFDAGREQYEEMNSSWNVMSKDQLDKLNEMDDEYQKLQIAVEDLKREALSNLAEPMSTVLEKINGLLEKITEWLNSEEGQETVAGIVEKITGALDWFTEHSEEVVAGIGAIAAAFGGLKLATFGLNIAKTFSGLKGLLGGNGTPGGGDTVTSGGNGATGGGWATIAMGKLASSKASMLATQATLSTIAPVIADMFLNQTNAGRGLRDGGGLGGLWEGLKQDVEEKKEEIRENVNTFTEDWDDVFENNPIFKALFGRTENQDAPERLGTANWAPSYMGGVIGNGSYQANLDRMTQTTAELTGATEEQSKSSTEMAEAAKSMETLPDEMVKAIQKIGFTFTLEGQPLVAYVSSQLAADLANRRYVP